MNFPSGLYESAYTMNDNGEIVVVSDRIAFRQHDGKMLGVGEPDEDDRTMELELVLAETQVTGIWEECTASGHPLFAGTVDFVPDGTDRFVGQWQTVEGSSGTWVLIRSLGQTATQ